ncbi:MAG: gliding motility-associated C-terminal domain-containing protein [Saprospiraceae bacterium]|nr:gliding motility-associated C-terminal domain-containing protein [Saprospiraceae bacterium]
MTTISRFLKTSIPIILGIFFLQDLSATHNRAGEITYRQIDNLTIEATVTTYTKASSVDADRDTVTVCWGDGTCNQVVRRNGVDGDLNGVNDGEFLPNDIKINKYIFEHTYGGQGHYVISMMDPNRNADICNINFPNPDGIPFFIRTTATLFNVQDNGFNSSPILLQPPIDIACIGQPFLHNPGAYDPDGDSLSYELVVPLQQNGIDVPSYESPAVLPNSITINPVTGDLIWASPEPPCFGAEYNVAFNIIEFRNGIPFDTLMRDMQIKVLDCMNLPPVIEAPQEVCVIAGEVLEFPVTVTAPISEIDQKVIVEANGSPFELSDSAVFIADTTFQDQPVTALFQWQTNCDLIRDDYYQVILRATDDFAIPYVQFGGIVDTFFLSTLKLVRIKVVGPPPEDVQALADKDQVTLSWEAPYDCEITENEYFRGFTVWKRIGPNNFPLDTCITGLDGQGYTKITPGAIQDLVGGRYSYLDEDVERGRTYCYRILAEFAQLTPGGGFPFNKVESLPSLEVCVQLSRDVPLITKVSVLETDPVNGSIDIRWTKPLAEDLDTVLNPGPYVYELYRAAGFDPLESDFVLVPGASFSAPTLSEANDTLFMDTGIDTETIPHTYRVAFYVDNEVEPIGFSTEASSVFLDLVSTDERNELFWEARIPWDNYSYIVYRKNNSGTWESIAITEIPEYIDNGLINGEEYCYYVETEGSYGIQNIVSPLFNDSQEKCGVPLDTIPPCAPTLRIENICDDVSPDQSCLAEDLKNTLRWNNPNIACDDTDDVIGYNIYYATTSSSEFDLIGTILNPLKIDTTHSPEFGLAGCYAITAIDSFQNESLFSNIECPDNCPNYQLPNVFTPNKDGANDIFTAFPFCFIERIEFKAFNRWGQLVFQTTDPNINWDGTNLNGKELAEGTYYYSCRVFEQRVSGVSESPEILSGFIELIRGR